MKIEFKFNSKSSGQNIPEALSIAEKCGGIIENKFYTIDFETLKDKNLERLYELVGNLKGTTISIDGEESVNASKFFQAINCPEQFLCSGLCKHYRIGNSSLDNFKDSENIEENVLFTEDERLIRSLTSVLEFKKENQFKLNKSLLLEQFKEATLMENKFCPKYNLSEVEKELDLLPDSIQFLSPEEYAERFEEPEEIDVISTISKILTKCEISSKISFNDILKCSQILSLLYGNPFASTVEGNNILIYSFPLLKKVIFLKFVFNEEMSDISEISEEEEEPKLIIEKKDEFFNLSNPYCELFFQMFDEGDSTLKENFEKLKLI